MPGLEIGSEIPKIILKNQKGVEFNFEDYKGKYVLLSFHPLAWTSVCEKQMKNIESHYDYFTDQLNIMPFGISIDHTFCKNAWAKAIGVEKLNMLADFWPTGELAKACNIFRDNAGSSERADLLFDGNGKLVFQKIYPISEVPNLSLVVDAVMQG